MKINPNKKPEYFCVATSFLMTTTLHAAGITPINVTLSSGTGTNIINTTVGIQTIVEYKIEDVIGKGPSRTWLWASPATPYISRVNSLHAPDCSTYHQPNSNPKSFMLPPSGVCYFALQVSGTQFANTSTSNKATYRPVFSNSGTIEYGPCLSEQLQIIFNNPVTPIITVGTYISGTTQRPLLAFSKDLGESWTYPESINAPVFTPTNPNPFTSFGYFYGASCNSSVCIAVGRGEDNNATNRPLLAITKDFGGSWAYPQSVNNPIFTPASSVPFGAPTTSKLNSASCNDTLCIAVGEYRGNRRPLLTYTPDLGNSWIYPGTVTDPVFTPNTHPYNSGGTLNSASCSNNVCVAVGSYNTLLAPTSRPMLVQSQNSGANWDFPGYITDPPLTTDAYDNNGGLVGVSCSGSTCVAVGSYEGFGPVLRPLLAVTNNSGNTWNYVDSVTTPTFLPPTGNAFDSDGLFNGVSCIGSTCVAVGTYRSLDTIQRPLLAVSHDSGINWTFPYSITEPDFVNGPPYPFASDGQFNSVSCTNSICIAVGSYVDTTNVVAPLLAQSLDSGNTWEYPALITAPIFMPNDTNFFDADGGFNSAQCNEDICIASGRYVDNNGQQRPLLASSTDKGTTWIYSQAINETVFSPNDNNPYTSLGELNANGVRNALLPKSLQFLNSKELPRQARVSPLASRSKS